MDQEAHRIKVVSHYTQVGSLLDFDRNGQTDGTQNDEGLGTAGNQLTFTELSCCCAAKDAGKDARTLHAAAP